MELELHTPNSPLRYGKSELPSLSAIKSLNTAVEGFGLFGNNFEAIQLLRYLLLYYFQVIVIIML